MKVSVIIPTYNRAYILPEAIESVLRQTYSNFELIVVDDGSTDETAKTVERFCDPHIRFVRRPRNGGVAAAKNTGLDIAGGELIATLDSDDLWRPQKLELHVKFLEEHPEVGGVFSDLEWTRGTQHVASMLSGYPVFARLLQDGLRQGTCVFSEHALYTCLLEEMPMKLQASTLRADCVRRVGHFDESWRSGEDWEFALRFARICSLGYIDLPLTVQRTLADSTLQRHQKLDASCLMERFIREKRQLNNDPDALEAVRRGIAHHAKELGHQYLNEGDKTNAMKTYWRGFNESGDPKFLARVAAAPLPAGLRNLVKRFRGVSAA
jgi:glycosyltransferase involved in cell wall biosynthesis